MKNRKIFLSVLAVFMLLMMSACGGKEKTSGESSSGDVKTIKYAFSGPETHIHYKSAMIFKEEVEKRSKGKIKVDLYPNNTLGTDAETLNQLKSGSVQMANIISGELANTSGSFNAWFMPFLFNDSKQAYEMGKTKEAMALFDTLSDAGVHSLGYFLIEMRDVLAKDELIEDVKQFKGMNIRVTPSPAIVDFWKTLGANPTPIEFNEIYSAFQTGVINTIDSGPTSIAAGKYHEVGKKYTTTTHMAFTSAILVSDKFWGSLSDDEKKIIEESTEVAKEQNLKINDELAKKAMDDMKSQGVEFAKLKMTDELKAKIDDFIAKYESKDEKIKAFVEKAREISGK